MAQFSFCVSWCFPIANWHTVGLKLGLLWHKQKEGITRCYKVYRKHNFSGVANIPHMEWEATE